MKLIAGLVFFSILSNTVSAACTFEMANGVSVKWQATKTSEALPVTGTFKTIDLKSTKADSIESMLQKTSVTVDGMSVSSGDEGRDGKLARFFFGMFADNAKASGVIKSVTKDTIMMDLAMNGVSKEVSFKYTTEGDVIKADSVITFEQFSLVPQYESIGKVCSVQHQGVMGKSIKIMIEANIKKECK